MTPNIETAETKTEQIFNDYNNAPNAPEKTPLDEVFNPTPAPVLFDKNESQRLPFVKKDDGGRYELEFGILNLSDADLKEFDRLSFVKIETEGDNQIFTSDDLDACEWFFDNCVKLCGGFDGELPENWTDSFDLLEKQAIVREFLSANVYSSGDGVVKTKRLTFGTGGNLTKIEILAVFGGREIICTHKLPANKNNFLRRFIKITQGLTNKKGKTGTYLPETWQKLGQLFDEMDITVSGYVEGGIPL
ncbi:MAG TPA: hypothetical protein PKE69_27985, partial [Pyrinomonadaceae bacterium]|nr:hypothetical protein [Pyrinomonadaceae bacterium]